MRRPLSLLALALAALALVAAGCGSNDNKDSGSSATTSTPAQPAGGGGGAGGTVEVNMKNIEYVPKAVTAKVGQTVHWTNGDSVAHTVTSKSGPASFDSGTLDPGSDFSFKVTKAGVINYVCQIHPNQTGVITVS
jgi:plastocyanin